MNMRPRMARRPDLVSTISAVGPSALRHDANAKGVKEQIDAAAKQQIVGGCLVGGGVVSEPLVLPRTRCGALRPPSRSMRASRCVGYAVHDLADIAMNVGEQAAERGDAGGGPGLPRKAVPLNQDGLATTLPPPRRRLRYRQVHRQEQQPHSRREQEWLRAGSCDEPDQ